MAVVGGGVNAPTLTVASYNMRKAIGTDRRRKPERTLDVLNELDADVIALQEADRRFGTRTSAIPLHMIDEHSDYKPVAFETRDGSIGWHGNALLVKKDEKEYVLKVALSQEQDARLHEEAEALRSLHSEFIVAIDEGNSVDRAVIGAAKKVVRALDHQLGKLGDRRGA